MVPFFTESHRLLLFLSEDTWLCLNHSPCLCPVQLLILHGLVLLLVQGSPPKFRGVLLSVYIIAVPSILSFSHSLSPKILSHSSVARLLILDIYPKAYRFLFSDSQNLIHTHQLQFPSIPLFFVATSFSLHLNSLKILLLLCSFISLCAWGWGL